MSKEDFIEGFDEGWVAAVLYCDRHLDRYGQSAPFGLNVPISGHPIPALAEAKWMEVKAIRDADEMEAKRRGPE